MIRKSSVDFILDPFHLDVEWFLGYEKKSRKFYFAALKTKKPRASVCPRLDIKLDDQSTHGQTPPVIIKIKILPGLIDIILIDFHYRTPL
jgi:hypothetical protein